jgi:outer membrane protein assembly factor BamB
MFEHVKGSSEAALAALSLVLVVTLSACGGSDKPKSTATNATSTPSTTPSDSKPDPTKSNASLTGSGYANNDLSNTRSAGGKITSSNVKQLKPAWTHPLTAQSQYGAAASIPVIAGGVVYFQDLESNVEAIDLESGDVIWSKEYNSPSQGPNGIVVGGGRVFGATAEGAFALDQKTGKEIWFKKLIRNDQEGIDMTPGYRHGMVYVSTVPGNNRRFYTEGSKGILWALNAETGKRVWSFDTAPTETWSKKFAAFNLGGGLWHAPAFDKQGGIYFGVGNPGPWPGAGGYPWGKSRPGPNLYTNSLVKLDAKTGKLKWYYQLTPHDLYDWDLQDPPILTKVKGKPAVIGGGKAGILIAVDRKTGKLLWKRPVGQHNGHDNDNLYAMRGQYSKLKDGEEVYPGVLGGIIAPMATDGKLVYVPVVNNGTPFSGTGQSGTGQSNTGEVVAVDINTGKIAWDQVYSAPSYGATTVANDVVFATTFDGQVYGLSTKTGDTLWSATLPAATNTGVAVSGDTMIAAGGLATAQGQTPGLVAYRLGG